MDMGKRQESTTGAKSGNRRRGQGKKIEWIEGVGITSFDFRGITHFVVVLALHISGHLAQAELRMVPFVVPQESPVMILDASSLGLPFLGLDILGSLGEVGEVRHCEGRHGVVEESTSVDGA